MTTGYNIREGAALLAERIAPETFWAVKDRAGDLWAIRETPEEAEQARQLAHATLGEALSCGHRLAGKWVGERDPVRVFPMSPSERAAALEWGVPLLDREG